MTMINKFTTMVSHLAKPGEDLLEEWTPAKASAVHMLVGLYDEWEEVKSYTDEENLIEEAGDFLFYLTGLAQDLEIEFDLKIKKGFEPGSPVNFVELTTAVKRHLFYNKPLDKDDLSQLFVKVRDCVLLKVIVETSLEEHEALDAVLAANYHKLWEKRYPNGYSNDAANKRADKLDSE